LVLGIIPPPELHLLLGAFKHLYDGWKKTEKELQSGPRNVMFSELE
jgi:hypothetical protein